MTPVISFELFSMNSMTFGALGAVGIAVLAYFSLKRQENDRRKVRVRSETEQTRRPYR